MASSQDNSLHLVIDQLFKPAQLNALKQAILSKIFAERSFVLHIPSTCTLNGNVATFLDELSKEALEHGIFIQVIED